MIDKSYVVMLYLLAVFVNLAYSAQSCPQIAISSVSGSNNESCPSLSSDGLELYFYSDRPGGQGGYDIFSTTRSSAGSAWGPVISDPNLNRESNDKDPYLSRSGCEIYFTSDRDGGQGGADIWLSVRQSKTSQWGQPQVLSAINSFYDEGGACLSDDGLTLYFHSNRPGQGGFDIYAATRTDTNMPFNNIQPLVGINSPDDEMYPFIDFSGKLYFSSNCQSTHNGWNIWFAVEDQNTSTWQIIDVEQCLCGNDDDKCLRFDGNCLYYSIGDSYGGLGGDDIYFSESYDMSGDIDSSGRVDIKDIALAGSQWLRTDCNILNNHCEWADINHDGCVNIDDIGKMIFEWLD